jgi:hypothetical protein
MSTTKNVIDGIYNALIADPTLAAYVKKYYKGWVDGPMPIYPFVGVSAKVNIEVAGITIGNRGHDQYIYTVPIIFGTQNNVDDYAWRGNGVATKGIIDLMDDILALVRPNSFGIFEGQVDITNCEIGAVSESTPFV